MTDSTIPHNHVAIIGTGFGGIATAVRLQQDGFHDFVLLERANDIGGVWRDNDYPGAAVDVLARQHVRLPPSRASLRPDSTSDAARAVADTGCVVSTVTGQARQATRKTGY
jgi:cation diffusion facilitator CzcD-associated flavoprotein CzcO